MGDLDRGLPGGGFPIEGEEPVTREGVKDAVDRFLFHLQGVQVAPSDATAGVLAALAAGFAAEHPDKAPTRRVWLHTSSRDHPHAKPQL